MTTKVKKQKTASRRSLFRVSWAESRLAWRVRNGQDSLRLLQVQSDRTQAATPGGAVKNIKKTHPLDWSILTITQIEKYDPEEKQWDTVQEIQSRPQNYRDYPASDTFQRFLDK